MKEAALLKKKAGLEKKTGLLTTMMLLTGIRPALRCWNCSAGRSTAWS